MLITYLCITYIRTFEAPLRSQLRSLLGERQVSKLGAQKQELLVPVHILSDGGSVMQEEYLSESKMTRR